MRLKKFFKSVGVFLAVLVFIAIAVYNFYTDLIDPYLWHKSIVKQWQDAGWKVASTSDQPSLMFPWTSIWRPLGMVTFVRDDWVNNLYRTDGKPGVLITAVVARFNRDDRGRIDASNHVEAFDCSTGSFAIMADVETKQKFDIVAADGSPLPGKWYPRGKDLAAYFCKSTVSP